MIRVAVVGLGKMGLSHLAMIKVHPDVDVVGVCDSTKYMLDVLGKYTGVATFSDYDRMLATAEPDAVIVATPTNMHAAMVRSALERGLHVFCEKPFVLDPGEGESLVALATAERLVTQVGYHNRFVGSFREVKRLLDLGAIGDVVGGQAEAYGPVVLKSAGRTWRSSKSAGGGCLYDYAAHPLDLVTWYLGEPSDVVGRTASIFSREIDDIVTATLHYPHASVQLNVNWSDESQRKMTTKITLWGTNGRIYADRQEIQVFLRSTAKRPEGYSTGWNVHYATELSEAPYFYVRGEEYSAQLDEFVRRIGTRDVAGENNFESALRTDRVIAAINAGGTSSRPSERDRVALAASAADTPLRDAVHAGLIAARRGGAKAAKRAEAMLAGWKASRRQR